MKKNIIEKTMFFGAKPKIFEKAKLLRENMTETEQLLWERLSKKKIKGYRFKAQHPISKFIVDFYCHKAKLVIEIDGSIHNEEDLKERDEGRAVELEEFGLKVIRFKNEEIIINIEHFISKIKDHLR
jgi:very-short-patch-repair endonuclease